MTRPISPLRRARLVALADFHDQWAAGAEPRAVFRPEGRPGGSDYNQHFVDVDAASADEDVFHAGARQIMGITD